MIKAQTLAELVLRQETQESREKIGRRSGHDYDLERSLESIEEIFLTTTPLGFVVEKEGLQATAFYTYKTTDSDEGWNGIEITLQEGISCFITMPRFQESRRGHEIMGVSIEKWPDFMHESIMLLQWVSRAKKMLKENVWLPKGDWQ